MRPPANLASGAGTFWIYDSQVCLIVNIASTSGSGGDAALAAYSSLKAALKRPAEALAGGWVGPREPCVNALAPEAFATLAGACFVIDSGEIAKL